MTQERMQKKITIGPIILLYRAVFQNILPAKCDPEIYAIFFICQTAGCHCTGQCLKNASLQGLFSLLHFSRRVSSGIMGVLCLCY